MTMQSLFILLPSLVSGGILAHLIWPDREFRSVLFKGFLGIGLGLGINSLLFFVFLLLFNQYSGFFGLQIFIAIFLVVLLLLKEWPYRFTLGAVKLPGRTQIIFMVLAGVILILALSEYGTMSLRKPQGAWDAWMIYNRTARFIYRGGDHWRDAFSSELYWFFHADYPPMLGLIVSSGWGAIGQETVRVPILIGGAFLFGCAGLLFAGLSAYKTFGQGVLALLVLFSTAGFIQIGSGQVADIPLSFFILATAILFILYSAKQHKGLLVLAGLSAGLAGWTKNEGVVFILASLVGLVIAYRTEWRELLPSYFLGLAVPFAILVYFKAALAPPGDLFAGMINRAGQITDLNRHFEILKQLGFDVGRLVNWVLLAVYALVLGLDKPNRDAAPAYLAFLVALLLQLVGYYSIFLVSPHPVLWHLSALGRLLLQIGPLIVFLYFSVVKPPETIFQTK